MGMHIVEGNKALLLRSQEFANSLTGVGSSKGLRRASSFPPAAISLVFPAVVDSLIDDRLLLFAFLSFSSITFLYFTRSFDFSTVGFL
jgi:hypothetical protein